MQGKKEGFDLSYESSMSLSYLVLKAGEHDKVQQYQVEMLASSQILGILPLNVRHKDDAVNFYYNITSKIPLSHLFARKKLTKNEFIGILEGIASAFLECGNFLLSEKCFLLDEDYIYITPGTLEISLVYVPFQLMMSDLNNLKDFIIKLSVYSANIDESSGDNFLQRILACAKNDSFSIAGLDSLLKELKNGISVQSVNAGNISENIPEEKKNDIRLEDQGKNEKLHENSIDVKAPSKHSGIVIPPIQKKNAEASGSGIKSEREKSGVGNNSGTILIAVLSQIAIAVIIVLSSGFLKKMSSDIVTTYAGIGIIVLALDFFLFKKLFKGKKIISSTSKGDINSRPAEGKKPVEMSKREIRNESSQTMAEKSFNPVMPSQPITAAVLPHDNVYETTFLEAEVHRPPYLQLKRDGMIEEIPVTKPSFIIGRLRDQVDYVSQNNAVGKVHAEVILRDGNCFIKDLNSRNGTFINDTRIDSNKEYKIRNNDKIAFANSEYVFVIPGERNE